LNCAESAADYVTRLSTSLQSDLEANISASKKHDREKVETCLAGFPNVAARLKVVLDQVKKYYTKSFNFREKLMIALAHRDFNSSDNLQLNPG
jgi:hypothetical protein